MFYFAFAEIVQVAAPPRIMFQVIRHVFGEKNVTGIAAIHHPLRHVDASAGDIGLFVQVGDFVDWTAMNSHSDSKLGMIS